MVEILQLLVEHGAEVDTADENELTPLIIAAEKGSFLIFTSNYLLSIVFNSLSLQKKKISSEFLGWMTGCGS